jgi:hypothetical protein
MSCGDGMDGQMGGWMDGWKRCANARKDRDDITRRRRVAHSSTADTGRQQKVEGHDTGTGSEQIMIERRYLASISFPPSFFISFVLATKHTDRGFHFLTIFIIFNVHDRDPTDGERR